VSTGESLAPTRCGNSSGWEKAKWSSRLEVDWPVTGKTQVFTELAVDRFYTVREDSPHLEMLELKPYRFPAEKAAGNHGHAEL
jgi:hypothetical protein